MLDEAYICTEEIVSISSQYVCDLGDLLMLIRCLQVPWIGGCSDDEVKMGEFGGS